MKKNQLYLFILICITKRFKVIPVPTNGTGSIDEILISKTLRKKIVCSVVAPDPHWSRIQ
jgi:hypothetical protein